MTVALAVIVEFRRGFGKALFDFAALFIALRAVSLFHKNLAGVFFFIHDRQANQAASFAVSFVVLAALLWLIGKRVYDSTLISLDTFDPPLGAVLGVGMALIVGHAFVKTLFLAYSVDGVQPEALAQSTLGLEFLDFPTYHAVMDFLFSLGQEKEPVPSTN
jgi:uncharacterized membrane protein required for colicin V production